jgi:uncharacterized protein YbjT (DUF2867 family)
MKGKTATVIGATGLIGGQLVEMLQKDDNYSTIKLLVRRPVDFKHPKAKVTVIDFSDPEQFRSGVEGSDAVFCAIGTTRKKVKGDQSAYRKVDHDIPVMAGLACQNTGAPHFLVVSSVGADSKSNNFYLKLKGEVEDELEKMKISSVSVFRPSMLLGKREEVRAGEIIAKIMTVPVSFLLPSRFRPINANQVAKAMIALSKVDESGLRIYHYKEMIRF